MGLDFKLTSNIGNITKELERTQLDKMNKAVHAVRTTTLNTLAGQGTGRTYKVPGTKRTYTASAPGEPPAQATGELRQHVSVDVSGNSGKLIGRVGIPSSAKHKTTKVSIGDYAICLEYGTKNMEPRPWLKRSFDESKPEVERIFGEQWL